MNESDLEPSSETARQDEEGGKPLSAQPSGQREEKPGLGLQSQSEISRMVSWLRLNMNVRAVQFSRLSTWATPPQERYYRNAAASCVLGNTANEFDMWARSIPADYGESKEREAYAAAIGEPAAPPCPVCATGTHQVPFFGVWRCSSCGETQVESSSPLWRWNGEAWEHKCGDAQAGHFPARFFGYPGEQTAELKPPESRPGLPVGVGPCAEGLTEDAMAIRSEEEGGKPLTVQPSADREARPGLGLQPAACECSTRKALVKEMVDRFLAWPLPDNFNPDGGISFKPHRDAQSWPVGTNLLDANQAEAMLRHILGNCLCEGMRREHCAPAEIDSHGWPAGEAGLLRARLEFYRKQFEDILGRKIEPDLNDNMEWALCAMREIHELCAELATRKTERTELHNIIVEMEPDRPDVKDDGTLVGVAKVVAAEMKRLRALLVKAREKVDALEEAGYLTDERRIEAEAERDSLRDRLAAAVSSHTNLSNFADPMSDVDRLCIEIESERAQKESAEEKLAASQEREGALRAYHDAAENYILRLRQIAYSGRPDVRDGARREIDVLDLAGAVERAAAALATPEGNK